MLFLSAGHSATTANMEDVGDEQTDEMLQILVNTAKNTKTRNTPRERKRGRTNRKSREPIPCITLHSFISGLFFLNKIAR